jgi:hypothetical protein
MVANRDSLIPQCRCKPQRAYRRHLADGIVLLMLSCALPGAMADTVDIAAVVGFTDTFRPGRWTESWKYRPRAVTSGQKALNTNRGKLPRHQISLA